MTIAEKIKIMQAAIDGAEIEYMKLLPAGGSWYGNSAPAWNWGAYEYRIKPKAKRKLYLWDVENNDVISGWYACNVYYENEEQLRENASIADDCKVERRDNTLKEVD